MKPPADRLASACAVPGCRGWSVRFYPASYLCSRHWVLVPAWMKQRRAALERGLKARGEIERVPSKSYWVCRTDRAERVLGRAWDGMVRAAIERASGVA